MWSVLIPCVIRARLFARLFAFWTAYKLRSYNPSSAWMQVLVDLIFVIFPGGRDFLNHQLASSPDSAHFQACSRTYVNEGPNFLCVFEMRAEKCSVHRFEWVFIHEGKRTTDESDNRIWNSYFGWYMFCKNILVLQNKLVGEISKGGSNHSFEVNWKHPNLRNETYSKQPEDKFRNENKPHRAQVTFYILF